MKKHWTGERLETFIYNQNTFEHLHRYNIAAELVKGKIVLDIASGEGYGSNLLAVSAKKTIGVDISQAAVDAAKKKYAANNLTFLQGSADQIPLEDASVDMVVSFETIEHHDKHTEMLNEIKRVLKPGGLMIMSSPDKKYYTDESGYINSFHIKELYFEEFKALVNKYFKNTTYLNQRYTAGSVILAEKSNDFIIYSGMYDHFNQPAAFKPVYNMVIASDGPITEPVNSIFSAEQWVDIIISDVSQKYTSSLTWKIGRTVLSPFVFLKGLVSKH